MSEGDSFSSKAADGGGLADMGAHVLNTGLYGMTSRDAPEYKEAQVLLRQDPRFGMLLSFLQTFKQVFKLGTYTVSELEHAVIQPIANTLLGSLIWKLVHDRGGEVNLKVLGWTNTYACMYTYLYEMV